jgi:hypothetical protein
LNQFLVDPTKDFTIFVTCTKTNTTLGSFLELSHHGTLARVGMEYNSTVDTGYAFNDAGAWAIANSNGVGGHIISQNNIHVIVLMRRDNSLWIGTDCSPLSKSPYVSNIFTVTAPNTTSLGAGWANSGGAHKTDTYQSAHTT